MTLIVRALAPPFDRCHPRPGPQRASSYAGVVTRVELTGLAVGRGDARILHDVDLDVASGTVVALVGGSGSGKTTILRAVAGLDTVTAGSIRFDDVDVTRLPSSRRDVALVFQKPALYPRRSVERNIAFPLELRNAAADEIRLRVGAEARALHIDSLLRARPRQLSAGQVQIVQIARALVRAPSVLLLDEPFAHLDDHRTAQIRHELLVIQRGFGVTTLVATNDSIDALTFADVVAVVEQGRVTQVGPPLDVYERPATASAALMTGDADVLDVRLEADAATDSTWIVRPGMRVRDWAPALRRHHGRRLQMIVRPEWWHVDPGGSIDAVVERVQRLGTVTSLWCRVGGSPMTVKLAGSGHGRLRPGDRITLRLERHVLLDPLDGVAMDTG